MPLSEPNAQSLRNPVLRLLLATRLAFLLVTLVGVFLGFATAVASGVTGQGLVALSALGLGLTVHAGVNVLNDYYDALNGTDAINSGRVYPFTGGSRFIQNQVLTVRQTACWGWALMAVAIVGGIVLSLHVGVGLIAIGLPGVLIGWAYSAPPLALNSRGLGEPCVAAGFALIVVGADYTLRRSFSVQPLFAALPYAMLVTNILYINQFPDREADQRVGKRHWVVRLGARRAVAGYWLILLFAHGWLGVVILTGRLPVWAAAAWVSVPLSLLAGAILTRQAERPSRLATAIKLTIAAAVMHGVVLALAVFTVTLLP